MVTICAVTGLGMSLVALYVGNGRDTVQLVQGAPAPPVAFPVVVAETALVTPASEARLPVIQQAQQAPLPATGPRAAGTPVERVAPQPPPPESLRAPPAMPVSAPATSMPAAAPAAAMQLTLADAQPLLASLLHHLESGRADRVLNVLEREARNASGAQSMSRHIDGLLAGGARSVKLSDVEFRSQQRDEKLLVNGYIQLHIESADGATVMKKLALRAEFMSRHGSVVMTGLSPLGAE